MRSRTLVLIGLLIVAAPDLRAAEDAASRLDMRRILEVTGGKGHFDDKQGAFKVPMPRADLSVTVAGARMMPPLGLTWWATSKPAGEKAVVMGDVVVTKDQVSPVMDAALEGGPEVTALAKGLKAALGAGSVSPADRRVNASPRAEIDFEDSESDRLPAEFTPALTGEGAAGSWKVVQDETAPRGGKALEQVSDDPAKARFPLCVYQGLTARDVAVSVNLRPMSGKVDQAGGIIWRYRDRDNYYLVRANALEGNVVLYRVENGKRTDLKPVGAGFLAYGKKVEVPAGKWSELRVVSRGAKHSVYFNGEHLFDVEDETFSAPGRVGLWTKADSVTRFDGLVIENLDGG
jgi:hypothetical protein